MAFKPQSKIDNLSVRMGGAILLLLWIASSQVLKGEVDPSLQRRYIREYRVAGVRELAKSEVEAAVYPFLGPARTTDDVEMARAAVEKIYQEKGFEAASVEIPVQEIRNGVVILQVYEGRVGRLRIKGSRYFSPGEIKKQARSLAEGKAINFHSVNRDIVALNQLADRRVTPILRAGEEPGTVDIDLEVKDTFPLHGSLELNNRYSLDTTPLRLNASLSYSNLWQLGHTIGAGFQGSPEKPDEVQVLSGFYVARFPQWESLSLMLQGTKQNSNVSTLGAVAVAGKGETLGTRFILTLPPQKGFLHNVALGIDYKHYNNALTLANITTETPLTYFPLTLGYNAMLMQDKALTEFNANLIWSIRDLGSQSARFEQNRYAADGNFIYLRGDISRTEKFAKGFEIFGKIQGQLSSQPLVSSEQFGGGGVGTVRGYLEAEVVGDSAIFGSLELRTPQLLGWLPWKEANLQLHAFGEAGAISLNEPLPEQNSSFKLASVGVGGRMQLFTYLNGSLDISLPLTSQTETKAYRPSLTFRVWADF